jgi:hypothetical protein
LSADFKTRSVLEVFEPDVRYADAKAIEVKYAPGQ